MPTLQRSVLIIDDNNEDRATFRSYLERDRSSRYQCYEASTAAEGLELYRTVLPNAILLDYSLPDDSGLAFLKALLAEQSPLACAVIMLTGAGSTTVAVQALKLGAHDYLVKDYDIRQRLIRAVSGAIEKVELQRQLEQQRRELETSNQRLQQALAAQRASEAQLHMALQSARMATWEWNLATNEVRWGPGLEEMLGMPGGSFAGSFAAFQSLLHPDDIDVVREGLAAALRDEAPYEVEFRMRRPDGGLRWTATRGSVVRDAEGAAIAIVGVDMDITAQKQVEEKLRASEERARVIWNSAGDAMALSDADGIVLEANQAYCDLYGYRPEQLIGRSFTIIFPPERRAEALAQYLDILRTRAVLPSYEATIQRANGEVRAVESRADVIATGDGRGALLSVVRDITERKRIAEQLRRSEAQFKTLVENAPDIITRFDRQLRHLYVSPIIERVTGRSQASFIGKTNRELGMPEEQCALWEAQSSYVFETGQPSEYEFTFVTPEGELSYQARVVPEFAEDGSVETLLSIVRDISAYKRAEERMRFLALASKTLTSSLDYRTTLEQVARLVLPYLGDACIIDLAKDDEIIDMVVTHIDPQHEELLREIRSAYPPVFDSAHPAAQVLRTRRPLVVQTISQELLEQNIASEGQRMLVERLPPRSMMSVPLIVRDQSIGAISLYATQAPRRYSAEDLELLEELARRAAVALDNAQLYQEAQEAVREREDFLAIASHEVKNPLTTLLGRAQLLQRRLGRRGESERELLDVGIMVESGQRINRLLSELLDVSRASRGQTPGDMAPLDLAALVGQVAAQMQFSAPARSVTIVAPPGAVTIRGDASRLEQVFYNLISNAIKYSPGGGDIQVEIATQQERARVSVTDGGIGIPAESLPHLFKRFYRVSSSETAHIGGTGVGLFVVKEIVTSHGGTVKVHSTEGVGSTFTVYLPLAPL